jgi:cysteine desulfurase
MDYNATTPVDPRVIEAMEPYLTHFFGNPSSVHPYGETPRVALADARARVAGLLGARPEQIVFTSSGSEANLLAVRGALLASEQPRRHVITQATEHPSVLETCAALQRLHDVRVTVLPVDSEGILDPAALEDALRSSPGDEFTLVSVMTANNETGAIQDISRLADIAHSHGALVHSDAAQAAGKIAIDVNALDVDLLTVVGHKMYAPKGTAALYVRDDRVPLEPVVYGGGQERGLRAGTENVALAVALGTAAEFAAVDLAAGLPERLITLRDDLHQRLTHGLPGRVQLNGPTTRRLPNTLNISIADARGHELLAAATQIAASTGSACHSGDYTPSPVLASMGKDPAHALGAVRLSLGRWTSREDVSTTADALIAAAT